MPSTPANAMRISNPPNPARSTSLLSTVGMRPTRDTALVFILPSPDGILRHSQHHRRGGGVVRRFLALVTDHVDVPAAVHDGNAARQKAIEVHRTAQNAVAGVAGGALLRGLLPSYDAVAHGPGRHVNAQFRVGHAGVWLQESLNQSDLGGRVIDGLRDIDDALFIGEGLDDFRTVFPVLPIAPSEESSLHLPGEHGPATPATAFCAVRWTSMAFCRAAFPSCTAAGTSTWSVTRARNLRTTPPPDR